MLAERLAERPVQKMRRRVVAHDLPPALLVDRGRRFLADAHVACHPDAFVGDHPLRRLLRVLDAYLPARSFDDSRVPDLAAGLGVERRALEKDVDLVTLACAFDLLARAPDPDDPGLGGQLVIAGELRVGDSLRHRPLVWDGSPRALALRGHLGLEGRLIDGEVPLRRKLPGELERKAERVVESEGVRPRDGPAADPARGDLLELLHSLRKR